MPQHSPGMAPPRVALTIGSRSETREPASGGVTVQLEEGGQVLEGEMVDVSPSGFRIRYRGQALQLGLEVRIAYPWGKVRAAVVWVSEIEGAVETGFVITG